MAGGVATRWLGAMDVHIRLAKKTDVQTLAILFHETVMTHGPEHYTAAQTNAWAASTLNIEQFEAFILGIRTYVAATATGIIGFSGLAENGHVTSLYVRHDRLKQGIGSALLTHVIEQAQRDRLSRLYAEASEFSRGLFQKMGFQHYDTEIVERFDVSFTRYLMEKRI